jgi:hypothetical protein
MSVVLSQTNSFRVQGSTTQKDITIPAAFLTLVQNTKSLRIKHSGLGTALVVFGNTADLAPTLIDNPADGTAYDGFVINASESYVIDWPGVSSNGKAINRVSIKTRSDTCDLDFTPCMVSMSA